LVHVARILDVINAHIYTGSENSVRIVKRRDVVNNLGEPLKLVGLKPRLILHEVDHVKLPTDSGASA
jgi:hypothetical protein